MYSLSSYMQRAMARCIWVTWKTHAVITHTRSSFSFLYCGLPTHLLYCIEYEINRRATKVGTFEVCVLKHDALHMFIMQVLASQFAVIKKMADVDFTTMLCEPELVMITARTVLFAYINLGINNIYLTNFMVLMLCLFGYLFKI